MKKVKLFFDSLELSKEGLVKKYLLHGNEIHQDIPLGCKRSVSFIICSARKLMPELLLNNLKIISSFPFYSDVVVIVGGKSERNILKRILKDDFAKVVINSDYYDTVYTSIKLGIKAINPRSSHIVVLFIRKEPLDNKVLEQLMKRAFASQDKIFVPLFNGRMGHPIVFSSVLRKELSRLRKEKGIPYLLRKYSGETARVEIF